ncbi:DUF3710 domain-containing protein [Streptomyces sp. NPDC059072]|uniref:DUF3710 domain-containing protein n=1 Tax=Streptomyces sp. NPDC059072 TaxID=3346715 RepID=UPI00369C773D
MRERGGTWREPPRSRRAGPRGEAEQRSGRVGVEVRAEAPVVSDTRGRDSMTVRFLGCDGPGWLLRGVISGEATQSASRDDWAYAYFERVVVVPSFVPLVRRSRPHPASPHPQRGCRTQAG